MIDLSIKITKERLEKFVTDIFQAAGLKQDHASIIARHLVLANLRGVDSHGVSRVDLYTKRLDAGVVSKTGNIKIEKESFSSLLIDGANQLGILAATKGMELAVQKAKESGICVVGIKNSNHAGMLADYTEFAAKNNCIAIATTNAPSSMAPWGGRKGFFGTNPISYAFPTGENELNIVFDMATSVVARGKIILAHKNNQDIPLGWAMTKEGKQTTSSKEALEGLVLPVGGPKGYGLAFFVDVLSGLFTGAAYGPHLGSIRNFNKVQNVGQFFFVMRADLFEDLNTFKARIDQMIREIREIPLAEGVERIYLPGEIEFERKAERESNGIPLSVEVVNELNSVALRYSIEPIN